MRDAWDWLRDHWHVPLVALAAVVGALVGGLFVRELRRPDKLVRKELAAIDAGRVASQDAIERGAAMASLQLREQHAETIKTLDANEQAKLERLRRDPRELARWLTRLSDRAPGGADRQG